MRAYPPPPTHPAIRAPRATLALLAITTALGALTPACGQKAPDGPAKVPALVSEDTAAAPADPGPSGPTPAPASRLEIVHALNTKKGTTTTTPATADLPTAWLGQASLPGDKQLGLSVRFTPATATTAATATLTITAQGLSDAPLTGVVFTPSSLAFDLPLPAPPGAVVHFALTPTPPKPSAPEGTPWSATGTLTQSGATFPVDLSSALPMLDIAPPAAPDAAPPPYTTREVTVPAATPGVTLAGTLTLPAGPGPHPAVIFITGSGAQDRDETIFQFKPFTILADAFARQGIASLRLDDRGVGGSGGTLAESPLSEAVADVINVVRFLAADPDTAPAITAGRIGLIGHSEGALVAALTANELAQAQAAPDRPSVAFIVSLAGPAIPLLDLLVAQQRAGLNLLPLPAEVREAAVTANTKALKLMAADAPKAETIAAIVAAMKTITDHSPELFPGDAIAAAEGLYAVQSNPRMRSLINADASAAWKEVKVPVLAVQGTLDFQVDPTVNLAAFRAAIPSDRLTVLEIPGANHLFQAAKTGQPDEYATLAPAFAPGIVDAITAWLVAR